MSTTNFQAALDEFDAANAQDPVKTETSAGPQPASLVYARRMTDTLDALYPDADEPLKLAARAQHIERWKIPRDDYPHGRAGYHKWRNDQKARHADLAAKIMERCGYDQPVIARVGDLIGKKNLATDLEAQALEDVACIVFFKYYAEDFATRHPSEKVTRIATKTWHKMSPHARTKATTDEDLPQAIKSLVQMLAASDNK